MKGSLQRQILAKCRQLLSEINRDPASDLRGCFDRRFWAWKLVDFPEATFQRNLAPLAWFARQEEAADFKDLILNAVTAGLVYSASLQHRNGSFDQAYPFEQSYGASAFLLPDLLGAYQAVSHACNDLQRAAIETCLRKTALFLMDGKEKHGYISNHLAGAAFGLLKAGHLFGEHKFIDKADQILSGITAHQSREGWYPEYDAADPGYQTLCMHYLAQFYLLSPSAELHRSLERSIGFLQYFIHPDGSFGGEYGSRRTEVYYPGGLALLSKEFPAAAAMHKAMLDSIENGHTVGLPDIDMGNTAPLLTSSILALEVGKTRGSAIELPAEKQAIEKHFPLAGFYVKGTKSYYCIAGASNGGVLKVFDKTKNQLVLDDCGLLGETSRGKKATTQITNLQNPLEIDTDRLRMSSRLYAIKEAKPSPFLFLLLRVLNLTLMRFGFLNEWIKRLMVSRLIKTGKPLPLTRERIVTFTSNGLEIEDHLKNPTGIKFTHLASGSKFSSIHMASARYFNLSQVAYASSAAVDVKNLTINGEAKIYQQIQIDGKGKAGSS